VSQPTPSEIELPVLDESRLLEEFGDDPAILGELRDLFLQHIPPLLDEIKEAHRAGDGEAIAKAAHSLKGASSTYGAQRVAAVCKSVETKAKKGQLDEAQQSIDLLETELGMVLARIAELMGEA